MLGQAQGGLGLGVELSALTGVFFSNAKTIGELKGLSSCAGATISAGLGASGEYCGNLDYRGNQFWAMEIGPAGGGALEVHAGGNVTGVLSDLFGCEDRLMPYEPGRVTVTGTTTTTIPAG